MREIPAEVRNLLKSRSMIGENKPSYEVSVQGMKSGDVDLTSPVFYRPEPTSAGRFSFAQCKDGRIIVLYSDSGATKLIQGYANSLEAFVANSSVSGTSDIFIGRNIRGTVFNDNSGELYLAMARTGDATIGSNTQQVRMFKSPSGNGGDWILYGTVRDSNVNEIYSLHRGTPIGTPLILDSGRWVLTYPYFSVDTNFIDGNGVATSDDNGVTWVHRNAINLNWNSWQSRTIVKYKNKIWRYLYTLYNAGKGSFYYSENDGESWTLLGDLSTHIEFGVNDRYIDISFFAIGDFLYFYYGGGNSTYGIYRTQTPEIITSWEEIRTGVLSEQADTFCKVFGNELVLSINHNILGTEIQLVNIPVKSISISRNKNMAGSLNLSIDNKDGEWSPDNTVHQNVLFPNSEITVKQGYGSNLVNTFTGLIDRIEMTTFPQELKLTCRDYTKYLLDQLVTKAVEGGNTHVLKYTAQTVEYIVTDLVTSAGLTLAETIYTTGITVAEITFSWCSWADAIQELADLVGADFGCDEDGKFYFRKDYIPDTPTIAYTFQEGEDIISLGYTIDDADIYQKVVCYGTKADGNSCFAQTNYTSRVYYNVLPNKYMKIDAGSAAQTAEAAQLLTDRAEILMRSRVRICQFVAVAVPFLQVGDVIRVIESSTTISEAYRITDLSTDMSIDGYTMAITCYHHSFAE